MLRRFTRPSTGLVYSSAVVYRLAMTLLEGSEGAERRRRIIESIPPGSSVVDLCCGDARIARALERRGCRYLGLDVNARFVRAAVRRGIRARYWDAETMEIPEADVVCMLSSLYQFIPNERELFERMLASARQLVLISEPVTNWATSGSRVMQRVALAMTRVNGRSFTKRHSEQSLRALVEPLPDERVSFTSLGREALLVVRTGSAQAAGSSSAPRR